MRLRHASLFVLTLAVAAGGCEDTPLLVPSDAQILVNANPDVAEPRSADPSGDTLFSTVVATVVTAEGQVLAGRQISFSRSAGALAFNGCLGGSCALSGGSCAALADCPQPEESGPVILETDAGGTASVVLAVDADDPESVEVAAQSGAVTTPVTVTNPLGVPNDSPTVAIDVPSAVPCEAAAAELCVYGLNVSFVADVTDPDDDPVSCYEWRLLPSDEPNEVVTGASSNSIQRTYAVEQRVDVTLAVTDESVACDDATVFNATGEQTVFVCSNLAPNAVIAAPLPAATASLSLNGGTVSFMLSATGTTDSVTAAQNLDYQWDCASNQNPVGASVTCTYTSTGTRVVELTVTDQGAGEVSCAKSDTATVTLTVTP